MDVQQNLKKPFLIMSAILIGAGIIFVALKGDSLTGSKISYDESWRNSLQVVPVLDATSSLAVQRGLRAAENISSGESTSTTDIFSRKIFASYISVKSGMATGTALTDDQISGIANELVQNITPSKTTYTLKDLRTSPDNSESAFMVYSKTVNETLTAFLSLKKNELAIVADALNAGDEKKITPLVDIIAQYRTLEKNLLEIKTPMWIAPLHLRLIQGYAGVRSAITIMHDSFNDSIAVLGAFSQYKNSIDALNAVGEDYKTAWPIKQ